MTPETVTKEDIQKAFDILGIQKGIETPENTEKTPEELEKEQLQKALDDKLSEVNELKTKLGQPIDVVNSEQSPLGELLKAQSDKISSQRSVIETLQKSHQETVEKFSTEIETLRGEIEQIAAQPLQRKSALPGSFLEKAFADDSETPGKKILSRTGHKKELKKFLMDQAFEKGQKNEFYADAVQYFEATGGNVTEKVIVALYKDHDIKLVP